MVSFVDTVEQTDYVPSNLVPTVKEILFSRTFPGQNYHFLRQNIQDLKVINQDMWKKSILYLFNI